MGWAPDILENDSQVYPKILVYVDANLVPMPVPNNCFLSLVLNSK